MTQFEVVITPSGTATANEIRDFLCSHFHRPTYESVLANTEIEVRPVRVLSDDDVRALRDHNELQAEKHHAAAREHSRERDAWQKMLVQREGTPESDRA